MNNNWPEELKKVPIDWLLNSADPSVKFFTLQMLLEKNLSDPTVKTAQDQIMNNPLVMKILTKQSPEGYWQAPEEFYIKSKYKGTVWNTIQLAELGASQRDLRIVQLSEFLLTHSQDPTSGGFAYSSNIKGVGDHNKIIPCLTGNMLWALICFGYLKDARVQKGIDWITQYLRFDDGNPGAPPEWPYKKYPQCYGNHSCFMGIIKCLKALAEIPPQDRTEAITDTINNAVEYFLLHQIYKSSHNLETISKKSWLDYGFPLMWDTDILDILVILTKLKIKDPRMQEAITHVLSKQQADGTWLMDKSYNGRMLVRIEKVGQPSEWITMRALYVIRNFFR